MSERLILKRIVAGHYIVLQGDTKVGELIRDGRPGVDNYPWTWSAIAWPYGSGPADSRRSALDYLRAKLRSRS